MAQGCSGHYSLRVEDLGLVREQVLAALKEIGYRISRRGPATGEVKVEAIQGNAVLATIASWVPGLVEMGVLSRVKAVVVARKSLNQADDRMRLFVRVLPIREMSDEAERLDFLAQGPEEFLGDHLRSRRGFKKLVEELGARELI